MKPLAAVFLFALASNVFAQDADLINPDRPGIADGSAVVGPGIFQLEAGLERDHGPDGRSLATPLLFRYGLSKAFEMRVEGNGYIHADGANGFAPVSIGAKYHFADAPSMGVIARLFVPSGTGAQRSHATAGDVRLAADINIGEKWSLNPNIGVASQDDGDGRFVSGLAALTVQYNISDHANVFVDGALQSPEQHGGGTSLIVDVGGVLIVGRNTQLDVSAGWGAHGTTPPNVFLAAGISRRF
ncbi:MAG TPA: transporter [Thermoanaerobaculia bacterium]|nr:transporter [Thermoanaerobaculia bacterium]